MAEIKKYSTDGEPISLDEMKQFLWGAATRLRGQIDAAGYKEYIFPLLFFFLLIKTRVPMIPFIFSSRLS